jgi:methyl-accepting chemotaxis protein
MSTVAGSRVRFGIFWRLLLIFLFVSLTPLAVVWYTNYETTIDRLNTQIYQNMGQQLAQLSNYVNSWIDMNHRMLQQNAALTDMRSMQADRQNPILRTMTAKYEWTYLAFTVGMDGNNIGRSDGKPLTFYGDRKYVKDVLAGAPLSEEVVIGKTSGKPALIMATPILNDVSKLSGVLAIAMTVDKVSEQVVQKKIGKTGSAFLVDETGKVIAHQSEEFTKSRQDLSNHPAIKAAKAGKEQTIFTDDNGNKFIAFSQPTERNWTLVVQQGYDEAYADLEQTNRNSLVLLALTLVPVILIALAVSRSFSSPIRNLTKIAEAISMGTIDLTIDELRRKDEIGVLAAAIDRLRTSMSLALARLKR